MSREGNLKGVERESLVVAEFAKLGWETFSGNGCTSCDIIAMKDQVLLRVEVKGAYHHVKHPSGPCAFVAKSSGSTPNCREFDILVRVADNNEMYWQRSIFYKGEKLGLPLRDEYDINTTQKNKDCAQYLERK